MRRLSGPRSGRAASAAELGIPQLHCEQHNVDRPDLRRVIGDVRLGQMQIAMNAFYLETVLRDRIAMCPARDEENIMARRREARAEITAESTGSHGCNTHWFDPFRSWCGAVYRKSAVLSWPACRSHHAHSRKG